MRYQYEFQLEPFPFHTRETDRELLEMEQFEYLESEESSAAQQEVSNGFIGIDCSGTSVPCALMPEDRKKDRIKASPNRDGAFLDRTEGDRSTNLALQLIDYDVGDWTAHKRQHVEALTRISEFINNRLLQSANVEVTITGSTSRTGSKTYNDTLSCKRAACAADFIKNQLWGYG